MVGEYVRMVVSPYKMGTVKAARYEEEHTSFLFQQDTRFNEHFPDVWLSDADLEEFPRPTDEEVARINQQAKGRFSVVGRL